MKFLSQLVPISHHGFWWGLSSRPIFIGVVRGGLEFARGVGTFISRVKKFHRKEKNYDGIRSPEFIFLFFISLHGEKIKNGQLFPTHARALNRDTRAAAPGGIRWVSPLDQGKTTLMRRSLIMRWGGPRSETTQLMSGVDRFLPGKSPKCLRL